MELKSSPTYNRFVKNFCISFFIVLCIFLIIPFQNIQAAGQFRADYDVTYDIAPAGSAIVTERIILTNKQTNYYPKQYAVVIDTENINDVVARDDGGVIVPQITQADGKTQILLTFNQKIVGLGRQLAFTLRFRNNDVSMHNGNIWEVNIPGVAEDPDLGNYNVELNVPPAFGSNAYMSPLPANGSKWTKDQMLQGGISAAYGKKQFFALDLSYFLENSKVTPVTTEIALPPDTAFQKISIQSLEPRPTTVVRDKDGNWLARYDLDPGAKIHVQTKILAEIYLTQRPDFDEALDDPSLYTRPLTFWETSDPKIISLAQSYKTPEAIYHYVVNTLTYDYNRVKENPIRKGALAALVTPSQAICMEFTDLFIAIARAAGIPAREAVGFAYTTNTKLRPLSLVTDVLHAWPEYYDRDNKAWIPVDPTWGNTTGGVNYFDKLDFNHIVFAIHGISSTHPYPAGFYREGGKSGKNVNVSFAEGAMKDYQGQLETHIQFPNSVTAGFTANGTVRIQNTSGVSVKEANISIQATPFPLTKNSSVKEIPPFATLDFPIQISVGSYFTKATGQISATVNGKTENYYFSVRPMYWLLIPAVIIIISSLFIFWLLLVKIRIWKRKKKS